jgi:hypothetical protein
MSQPPAPPSIRSVAVADDAPEPLRAAAASLSRDLQATVVRRESAARADLVLWTFEDAQARAPFAARLRADLAGVSGNDWHAIYHAEGAWHVIGATGRNAACAALALRDAALGANVAVAREGLHSAAFGERYITWDQTCNQTSRFCKGFDRARHFEEACRIGLTGVEINRSPDQNVYQVTHLRRAEDPYPWINDYGLALDMYAESKLNQGTYPEAMLARHRADLAEAGRTAARWGLTPGMMCYEPRWVPERLFDRHPRLRGARVDHCGRSFTPRYTLDISLPEVLEHYRQLLRGVFELAPQLGYLHLWHCDSGAGYPYATYLYPGPNGSHRAKAKGVGRLVGEFLGALAEEGRRHNPGFKVVQAFTWEFTPAEWADVLKHLTPGVEVSHSLGIDEWRPIRDREVYAYGGMAGATSGPGHTAKLIEQDRAAGRDPFMEGDVSHSWDLEPCAGTDFPGVLLKKAAHLDAVGAKRMLFRSGFASPPMVSHSINNEVLRDWFHGKLDAPALLADRARAWTATPQEAAAVQDAWAALDHAILNIPKSTFFVPGWAMGWGQWLFRPLVPNRALLSADELAELTTHEFYLEDDPGRMNVFFEGYERIVRDDDAGWFVEIYDEEVLAPLDKAALSLTALGSLSRYASELRDRLQTHGHILSTYRHWHAGQRAINLALIENRDHPETSAHCQTLRATIKAEIDNLNRFAALLDSTPHQVVLETTRERNVYRHAGISRLLRKKTAVMGAHINDAPGPWLDALLNARERLTRPRPIGGGATSIGKLLLHENS